MKKRTLITSMLACAMFTGMATTATAAAYPSHEVKLVIPFAPGGATDIVFRLVSEAAEKHLGKPIVPMNMGGAGGSKGSTYVKNSKADGYTLLGGHEFLMTTYYGGMVNFGLDAFEPVCTLTLTPLTIASSTAVPYKNYQEMISYIKANPGKVTVSMTPASVGYVIWQQSLAAAGLDVDKDVKTVVINGVGPQTKSLLGGHVDLVAADIPSHLEYHKDGRLRIIVASSNQRLPQIPEVPTQKELGYNVAVGCTRAIFAPKGTPKDVIAKIDAAYRKAMQDPAVIKKIEELGNVVTYFDAKGTAKYFTDQDKVYRSSIKK